MTKSHSLTYNIARFIFFVLLMYGAADYIYDFVFGNDASVVVSFTPLMYYFLAIGGALVFLCILLSLLLLYIFLSTNEDPANNKKKADK